MSKEKPPNSKLEEYADRALEIANKYWKRCEEVKTLTAQIELLTKCECGDLYQDKYMKSFYKCRGCKNMAILEKEYRSGKEEA